MTSQGNIVLLGGGTDHRGVEERPHERWQDVLQQSVVLMFWLVPSVWSRFLLLTTGVSSDADSSSHQCFKESFASASLLTKIEPCSFDFTRLNLFIFFQQHLEHRASHETKGGKTMLSVVFEQQTGVISYLRSISCLSKRTKKTFLTLPPTSESSLPGVGT